MVHTVEKSTEGGWGTAILRGGHDRVIPVKDKGCEGFAIFSFCVHFQCVGGGGGVGGCLISNFPSRRKVFRCWAPKKKGKCPLLCIFLFLGLTF